MDTVNLIILDEKQIMAGSFNRYLKHRFGRTVKVSTVADTESCLKKINGDTTVVILNYMFDQYSDTERGANILEIIKRQQPASDVILVSSPEDARKDIERTIKQFERQVSTYILESHRSVLQKAVSPIKRAVMQPIRDFVEEHSIIEFLVMFLFTFVSVGIFVLLALILVRP